MLLNSIRQLISSRICCFVPSELKRVVYHDKEGRHFCFTSLAPFAGSLWFNCLGLIKCLKLKQLASLASQTLDSCGERVLSSSYAQLASAHSANFLTYTVDSNEIHDQSPINFLGRGTWISSKSIVQIVPSSSLISNIHCKY